MLHVVGCWVIVRGHLGGMGGSPLWLRLLGLLPKRKVSFLKSFAMFFVCKQCVSILASCENVGDECAHDAADMFFCTKKFYFFREFL